MKLQNQVIFITGGTSGIGLSLVKLLVAGNAKIIVGGRNADKLSELKKTYSSVETILCDVSSEESLVRCCEKIQSDFSGLSVLINNAGVMNTIDFDNNGSDLSLINAEINTNLMAPVVLTKLLVPVLLKQNEAAIVNISSGVAYLPMPSVPVYSATKAALHSFSISLRHQLRNTKIGVFEALPPVVDTNMPQSLKGKGKEMKKLSPDDCAKEIIKGVERGKFEIRIGDNKLLYWASRIFPSIAQKQLNEL